MMKRRGFLRLMGVAPIAAPVAAQEAASKMGLRGMTAAIEGNGACASYAQVPVPCNDPSEYVRNVITNYMTDAARKTRRLQARERVTRLDMDLAAMRSVSPAFAMTTQVDREVKSVEANEGGWLKQEAKRLGIPWIG